MNFTDATDIPLPTAPNKLESYRSRSSIDQLGSGLAVPTPDQEHETREQRQAKRIRIEDSSLSPPCGDYQRAVGAGSSISSSSWLAAIPNQLGDWVRALVDYNAKCKVIPPQLVIRLATAIIQKHYNNVVAFGTGSARSPTFKSVAAAAFWISIKFVAPRAAMPGASFMAIVTGVDKDDIKKSEVFVLESINWDVYALARGTIIVDDVDRDRLDQ